MRRKLLIVLFMLLGLLSFAAVACEGGATAPQASPTPQPPSPSPPPAAPATPGVTPSPGPGNGGAGQGQQIAQRNGCTACHSIDGSPLVGPTWQGLFGKTETLADGSTVVVNEVYIEESIRTPGAKIVEGFGNIMPPFPNLPQGDIDAIIEYIKTLR
ncbi:MAG: cytochrome c [Chloroflexi bacterium]|nr:cytochrome c [Chloroflexota bacterium]